MKFALRVQKIKIIILLLVRSIIIIMIITTDHPGSIDWAQRKIGQSLHASSSGNCDGDELFVKLSFMSAQSEHGNSRWKRVELNTENNRWNGVSGQFLMLYRP